MFKETSDTQPDNWQFKIMGLHSQFGFQSRSRNKLVTRCQSRCREGQYQIVFREQYPVIRRNVQRACHKPPVGIWRGLLTNLPSKCREDQTHANSQYVEQSGRRGVVILARRRKDPFRYERRQMQLRRYLKCHLTTSQTVPDESMIKKKSHILKTGFIVFFSLIMTRFQLLFLCLMYLELFLTFLHTDAPGDQTTAWSR